MTPSQRQTLGVVITLLSAMSYSLYPPASRAAYELGANASFMIVATTAARAVSLSLFCLLLRKPLFGGREELRRATTGGFFQGLSIVSIFAALTYMPGPVVIIMLFTATLMLLAMLVYKGETKATPNNVITALVSLFGITMVLDLWQGHLVYNAIGIGLGFMAAMATASRMYFYNHQLKNRDPAVVGAETFLLAFIFTLPLALIFTPVPPANPAGYIWTGLSCLSLVVSTFAMFYGIALIGSFQYSLMLKCEPIFTALLSAWLVNDVLKTSQYAGMGVVILSLAAYQIIDFRARHKAAKAA